MDYYATPPAAVKALLKKEIFHPMIWEPACGEGHIAEVLKRDGYDVKASDIIDRGYGEVMDFLLCREPWGGDIITNPPYSKAVEFAEHALNLVRDDGTVAMLLKLTFLESKQRKSFFRQYPFKVLYVFSDRIRCAKNGAFHIYTASAIAYGWYVWRKGFRGDPVIKWI